MDGRCPYDRLDHGRGRGDCDGASEIFAAGSLRGRVALVTGGGTGLGRATALELARCGATVTVAGRREEPLRETVAAIERSAGAGGQAPEGHREGRPTGGEERRSEGGGERTQWLVGDVRERAQARALVESVVERWGRLDVLVNNAGGQYFTPAEGIAAKGWGAVWRLNVDGMLNMARGGVRAGAGGGGGGRVINVTLSPHHGMPGMAHSGAARAAVEALTRELARSWAGTGIDGLRGGRGALRHGGDGEVPGRGARRDGALGAAAAPGDCAGARLARGAAGLPAGSGVQRVDRDAGRGAGQLVRAVAAAGAGGRRGGGADRGAAGVGRAARDSSSEPEGAAVGRAIRPV